MASGKRCTAMALTFAGWLAFGCTTPIVTRPSAHVLGALGRLAAVVPVGGTVHVDVRMSAPLTTKANPGFEAVDVTRVVLRLYVESGTHATFDYEGVGTELATSSAYNWTVGADASGNARYTFANLPVGVTAYVVTGHAFKGGQDVTKTVSGFAYARSSNSVAIAAGTTTYSAGSALALTIPLQDGTGNTLVAHSTVVDGADPVPTGGAGW
jgi:hypothetical protein